MDRRQRTSLLKRLGGMRRHAEAIHAVEEHFFWDLALVAHFVLEGGRWRRSHYSLQRDAFENEIPEDLTFPSLAALVASLVSDCDYATTMLLEAIANTATLDGDNLVIDRQAIRDYLTGIDGYEGIIGTISCDEYGDCGAQRIAVYEHQDGEVTAGEVNENIVFEFAPE